MKLERIVGKGRRALRAFVAAAACWGAISGCGGASGAGAGDLEVVVKDVSMAVVADATVTTDPATKSLSTGADGRAHFTGLAAGDYTVTAESAAVGVATAPFSLHGGESRELTLILRSTGAPDGGAGGAGGAAGGADDGAAGATAGAGAGAPTAPSILLQDLTKDTNGVGLTWSATSTFASYRIYRGQDPGGGFSVIEILNDAQAQTYRDEAITLGTTYHYRVTGVASDGTEVESNVQTITAGVYIDVKSQVERMIVDPQRPYLYAIDRVNNALHFINLTNDTLEKTIFIGSAPTSLDINMAGTELYVANSGSTEIAVVDLATRVKSRSLLVDPTNGYPSGNPYRLVCTAGGTLVYASQDSFSQMRLVNATTGATITTTASSNGGVMVASPDGTRVYSAGYSLVRYDIVGATMKQVDTSNDWGSSAASLARSGDGMYLFYNAKKVLANNLKSSLGTFPEPIQLANSTGDVAIGSIRIYDATTFTTKGTLPLATTVVTLSADDKTLFLYQATTSRIYLWKMP